MKVSCLQENLAKGISTASKAVAARSTLPVLCNILLTTDASRLKLSATNLEIGINTWVGAKVEQEGAITVPARILADLVSSLPPERIDLELIARTRTLNLKCERARFEANIKGIDAHDFPLILIPEEDNRLTLDVGDLRQMIDQVAFAAATDETRPVITGVLVSVNSEAITMAATDGYRISVRSQALQSGPQAPINLIIPARAMQELRRLAVDTDKPVEMLVSSNRNQVFFRVGDAELTSQLIEGVFPDHKRVVPTTCNTKTTVNTSELLKAARTALVFARDSANVVRVQIVPSGEGGVGRLIVTATSAEYGDNVSELDAAVEGAPVEIAFNGRYLIDALTVTDSAQVALETRDPSSPGVLRPVGGADLVHVIMPMHIAH